MTFDNTTVDPSELPTSTDIEFQPMAASYVREVVTQSATVSVVVLLVSMVPWVIVVRPVELRSLLGWLPLLVLALALILSAVAARRALSRELAIREHDLAFRSGLFWRKTVLLPFNRIQHVELVSGPLQRRFGLASIKCYTAGGSSVDLRVDGLSIERAERLREFVLSRIRERDDG